MNDQPIAYYKNPLEVNQYWKDLVRILKLDDPKVPEVQRREMKRAFFTGFHTCLLGMFYMDDDTLTPDQQSDQLESWMKQCEGFAIAVREGMA